jgi:hypothetical protein
MQEADRITQEIDKEYELDTAVKVKIKTQLCAEYHRAEIEDFLTLDQQSQVA